jgi:tyrosyl-tRNA synthetase
MAAPTDPHGQLQLLTRNAAEVIPKEELGAKLERAAAEGRPLRVKLGLDPTAGEVTLGWAVVLRKLREFQDLGHTAVLIVGDFTARVGDPSGKSETRPRLSKEEVEANAERVLSQFDKILSKERLEIRYNSEWLESMSMEDVLRMTSLYTVARMLERDDFAKRFAEHRPISMMEFLYPLLQAMDSVNVQADVELGGNDQKFNLLVGREIQKDYGQQQQVVFTMPLLVGLDGTRVMGQSLGNYVGISEPPEDMFGKLMRVPDELIGQYLELSANHDPQEVASVIDQLHTGAVHPNTVKRDMARDVVALYHGAEGAEAAEQEFDRVHKERGLPSDLQGTVAPVSLLEEFGSAQDPQTRIPAWAIPSAIGLSASRSEARRLLRQGGIRVNGEQIEEDRAFSPQELVDSVWQSGRRRFVRITGFAGEPPSRTQVRPGR